MLENFNDYLSLLVLVVFVFAGLRLLSGAISYNDNQEDKKTNSVLFDYTDNEDE